jgi:hypothetical protein
MAITNEILDMFGDNCGNCFWMKVKGRDVHFNKRNILTACQHPQKPIEYGRGWIINNMSRVIPGSWGFAKTCSYYRDMREETI